MKKDNKINLTGLSINSLLAMDFPETKAAPIPAEASRRQAILDNVGPDSKKAQDIADFESIRTMYIESKIRHEGREKMREMARNINDQDIKNQVWSIIEGDENLKFSRFARLVESLNS